MQKYNYFELRARPRSQPMPADVNEFVETMAKRLGGEELIEAMHKVKEKRLYGRLEYFDEQKQRVTGIFEFQEGICKEFKLVEYPTTHTAFARNIRNEKVNFSKNTRYDSRKGDDEQGTGEYVQTKDDVV